MGTMNWLPKYSVYLSLQHNEHKLYYQTLEYWLEGTDEGKNTAHFEWVSPEERAKALAEDSCWVIHWIRARP